MPYTVSGNVAVGHWRLSDETFIAKPSGLGAHLTFTTNLEDAALVCLQTYKMYTQNPSYLICSIPAGFILSLQYDSKQEKFVWIRDHCALDTHKLKTKTGDCVITSRGTELSGCLV